MSDAARSVSYEILREAKQFNPKEFRIIAMPAVIEMLLDEESQHLAGLSDFIGKPISLRAENAGSPERYDIVPMQGDSEPVERSASKATLALRAQEEHPQSCQQQQDARGLWHWCHAERDPTKVVSVDGVGHPEVHGTCLRQRKTSGRGVEERRGLVRIPGTRVWPGGTVIRDVGGIQRDGVGAAPPIAHAEVVGRELRSRHAVLHHGGDDVRAGVELNRQRRPRAAVAEGIRARHIDDRVHGSRRSGRAQQQGDGDEFDKFVHVGSPE